MTETTQPKKVFIAATQQDQGKTTLSLGLLAFLNDILPPAGFIKPVGQRYVEIDGVRVDEDVALVRSIYPCPCPLGDMSPVTVGQSFTRDYIRNPRPNELATQIRHSFARVSEGRGSVVIEGTGHAGVGSCFDTSNADVARLLGAKVILVAGGGIGKPLDEVMLNRSLFADRGVDLLGVVLNKVLPAKLQQVGDIVRMSLERNGIDLLGCIPYEPLLATPSVRLVLEEIDGQVLNGEEALNNSIQTVIVGAMAAYRALRYIAPGCLLITAGDREDMILAAVTASALSEPPGSTIAGIILTGGIQPDPHVLSLIRRTQIPVVLVDSDSYTAAAAVNNLKVKIQVSDEAKIHTAQRLVRQYVNTGRILERL